MYTRVAERLGRSQKFDCGGIMNFVLNVALQYFLNDNSCLYILLAGARNDRSATSLRMIFNASFSNFDKQYRSVTYLAEKAGVVHDKHFSGYEQKD